MAGLILLFLCATADWKLIVNYSLGYLSGLGFMIATEKAVFTLVSRAVGRRKKAEAAFLMLGKYGAVSLVLYLLARMRYLEPLSFTGGVVTLQAVLFLKAIGVVSMSGQQEEKGDRF